MSVWSFELNWASVNFFVQLSKFIPEWVGGWMGVKTVLIIAYSNPKIFESRHCLAYEQSFKRFYFEKSYFLAIFNLFIQFGWFLIFCTIACFNSHSNKSRERRRERERECDRERNKRKETGEGWILWKRDKDRKYRIKKKT